MLFTVDGPLSTQKFFGRGKAIQMVAERLASDSRGSSCLTGGPQTGKTSLLRYLCDSATAGNMVGLKGSCRVFYDAYVVGVGMKPAGFWTGVMKLLANHPATGALKDEMTERFEKAKANGIDLFDLEDVFDAYAKGNTPVVLFIDNFDILLRNQNFWPPDDFFHILRSLSQRVPRGLSFVVGSSRRLLDLWDPNKGASPFYFIFENIPVGLYEADEMIDYLKAGFAELGVAPDPEIQKFIEKASDQHPYLLNFVAKYCAEALKQGKPVNFPELEEKYKEAALNLTFQIREKLFTFEKDMLTLSRNNPEKLTPVQRERLRDLRAYALVPPGTEF